ncbi:T9SS type A sorting domain-containing protein [Paracrocinitomix mangrovi]|uniref:T9SS type A sorting domain-containing protein n=1 Tax=Paracrocinitomix mangrovi TaxID=2862509 RepID=UPI001C8ECD38|nr:T9SS type A sorting domain-containing protein [Paracrocinitomix mangrovi]UKN02259.1 T9SS type A sorting domain-containing protein [Paracrocinitomix mangrovi]
MKVTKTKMAAILSALCISGISWTQNWTGNNSSDWNDPANWDNWPLTDQNIIINPANYTGVFAHPTINANSIFNPAKVNIENGAQLTINADLTTLDDINIDGFGSSLNCNGGLLSVNPSNGGRIYVLMGGNFFINNGNVNVDDRLVVGNNGSTLITAGNLQVGNRIAVEEGGYTVQSGGSVTTAILAISDGAFLANSLYNITGGSLNITSEISLENELGNFEPTLVVSGGNVLVNGNLNWNGIAPGMGRPKVEISAGNFVIHGNVENLPGSTVEMHLLLHTNGYLNQNGGMINMIDWQDSIIQQGNSNVLFNGTSLNILGSYYAEGGATAFDGVNSLVGFGTYQFNDLQVNTSSSLEIPTTSIINISGNIDVPGFMDASLATIRTNGTLQQTLSGDVSQFVGKFIMDNTSPQGLDLLVPLVVLDELNLVTGKVNTDLSGYVVITDDAISNEGSTSSFINGPMIKMGNDAFVFPVGKNNSWKRASMSAPTSIDDIVLVEYFDYPFTNLTPVNTPLTSVSSNEFWQVEDLNGTLDVELSFYWEDASASGITNCQNLSIANWNGTEWDDVPSTATGLCSGNGAGNISTDNSINQFGVYSFGFAQNTYEFFVDICAGDSYSVGQNTYTQTGTYTDVLLDVNGNDSVVVTFLHVEEVDPFVVLNNGILESTITNADSFQWLDCDNQNSPISGETAATYIPNNNGNYAVLVNVNGCFGTSPCIQYNVAGIKEKSIQDGVSIYPNPSRGIVNLVNQSDEEIIRVYVYNATGEIVFEHSKITEQISHQVAFDMTHLTTGFYTLVIEFENQIKTHKLVIN